MLYQDYTYNKPEVTGAALSCRVYGLTLGGDCDQEWCRHPMARIGFHMSGTLGGHFHGMNGIWTYEWSYICYIHCFSVWHPVVVQSKSALRIASQCSWDCWVRSWSCPACQASWLTVLAKRISIELGKPEKSLGNTLWLLNRLLWKLWPIYFDDLWCFTHRKLCFFP